MATPFATAGARGGTPGSPTPFRFSALGTMWNSIFGIVDAHRPGGVEVTPHRAAGLELHFAVVERAQAKADAAFHLCADHVRIDGHAAVDRADYTLATSIFAWHIETSATCAIRESIDSCTAMPCGIRMSSSAKIGLLMIALAGTAVSLASAQDLRGPETFLSITNPSEPSHSLFIEAGRVLPIHAASTVTASASGRCRATTVIRVLRS